MGASRHGEQTLPASAAKELRGTPAFLRSRDAATGGYFSPSRSVRIWSAPRSGAGPFPHSPRPRGSRAGCRSPRSARRADHLSAAQHRSRSPAALTGWLPGEAPLNKIDQSGNKVIAGRFPAPIGEFRPSAVSPPLAIPTRTNVSRGKPAVLELHAVGFYAAA